MGASPVTGSEPACGAGEWEWWRRSRVDGFEEVPAPAARVILGTGGMGGSL